jgi:hypothetical protein
MKSYGNVAENYSAKQCDDSSVVMMAVKPPRTITVGVEELQKKYGMGFKFRLQAQEIKWRDNIE